MSPNLPSTFVANGTVKMLAVIEYWDQKDGCHLNNNGQYVFLLLCKLGLGMVVWHLCQHKWRSCSFLSVCALSFIVADALLACFMVTLWFLGPMRSPVSICFVLGHASEVYAALPVPTILLGLLDFALGDMFTSRWSCKSLCKSLCNVGLVLLMWTKAVVYDTGSVTTNMMEIEELGGAMALVCEVQESRIVSYFLFGLFIYVLFTLLPHYTRLYKWFEAAEKFNEQRNEPRQNVRSDLQFTSVAIMKDTKSGENNFPTEPQVTHRPSLCVSLTLGFASLWMPYLVISVICLLLGFGIPSYVIVNLLWLECINSVFTGVVFWLKSDTVGSYNKLPDDMCLCRGYWHLSKGTHQHKLPTTV